MSAILLALALAVQPQPTPSTPTPPPPRDTPSRTDGPMHAMLEDEADRPRPASAEARRTMDAFGRCVARLSTGMATDTLALDFRTRTYRTRLLQLANNNRDSCFRRRGRMRSPGLPFAGGLAEGLLAGDSTPLNVRLARAARGAPTPSFAPSDAIAICVVRSVPDDVARLFATEVASAAEREALTALAPVVGACSGAGANLAANDTGLRAILATAAFRTVRPASTAN